MEMTSSPILCGNFHARSVYPLVCPLPPVSRRGARAQIKPYFSRGGPLQLPLQPASPPTSCMTLTYIGNHPIPKSTYFSKCVLFKIAYFFLADLMINLKILYFSKICIFSKHIITTLYLKRFYNYNINYNVLIVFTLSVSSNYVD